MIKIKITNTETGREYETTSEIQEVLHEFNQLKQVHADKIKKATPVPGGTFIQDAAGTACTVQHPYQVEIIQKLAKTVSSTAQKPAAPANEKPAAITKPAKPKK